MKTTKTTPESNETFLPDLRCRSRSGYPAQATWRPRPMKEAIMARNVSTPKTAAEMERAAEDLVEIAAVMLTTKPDEKFTVAQLTEKVRELAGELEMSDAMIDGAIGRAVCLGTAADGSRWLR